MVSTVERKVVMIGVRFGYGFGERRKLWEVRHGAKT